LAVCHQLIHIGLTYTLFRIVDARCHPFPFRVDDERGPIALPDDEVRLGPKSTRTLFEQAISVATLRCNTVSAACQGAGDQSGDVFLEQGIHLEQKRVTINSSSSGLLMPVCE
jgi:hypothetical protein